MIVKNEVKVIKRCIDTLDDETRKVITKEIELYKKQ